MVSTSTRVEEVKEGGIELGRKRKPKVKVQLFSTCCESGQPPNFLGRTPLFANGISGDLYISLKCYIVCGNRIHIVNLVYILLWSASYHLLEMEVKV